MTLDEIDAKILDAGSDNHQYFGAKWTGGYYIQQDPKEFAELVELLHGFEYRNYLAIGIAAGGTERFICENARVGGVYVIDDGKHPNFKKSGANLSIPGFLSSAFIGDSHSIKAALQLKAWNRSFNLVGIDGDHSPQGVLQDWEMVQPYLAPGALVWFHDIHVSEIGQHGARKAWARLKTEHEVLLETNGKFGIGVLRVA